MAQKPKIYVAGPFGFSEAGRQFYYTSLIPVIQDSGYKVIDPWKLTDQRKIDKIQAMPYGEKRRAAFRRLNLHIGENNRNAIDRSDGLVAVLDGPDVDGGTASEIGYGYGRRKPIVGYRGDFRIIGENEASVAGLQVEYFIFASGGRIVTALAQIPEELRRVFKRSRR